jgi:hypothetical protein
VGLRLALSSALTADDAREAVLTQRLAWGYQARQPPLYNWLAWGAARLLGPGLLGLTVLKYAILVAGFWLVALTARRILADRRHAALATFAYLLVIPLSWTVHEALTHSVAVLAACAGTAYALVRLGERADLRAYVVLGLAVGLGVLSKYTYLPLLAALGLAALTLPVYRACLLDPRLAVTTLVAAACALPAALWFLGQGHDLAALYAREVRIEDGDAWIVEASSGIVHVLRIAAAYLTPIGVVLAACFPRLYRRLPPGGGGAPGGRLIGRLLAAVLLLLGAAALGGLLAYLKIRWLIPGFLLVPLYAFWRIERHGEAPARRLAAFAWILVAAEILVAGGLAGRVLGARFFPDPSRLNEPYDDLAAALRRAGFARGTIVAGFGTLAGNLRVRFPDSRVLHVEYPDFRPPPGRGDGQCLLAWPRRWTEPEQAVPADVRALAAAVGVALTGAEPVAAVEALFRFDPHHVRRVNFILLAGGAGDCR